MTPFPATDSPTALVDERGHGAPLVLVPGGLTGWLSWKPHAEELARERRVIRTQLVSVDLGLRGEPLPEGYSLATESAALLRALDGLQVDRADLVGWSYGGGIALDVALHHPDRVRSLTVIEPGSVWILRATGRLTDDAKAFVRNMEQYRVGEITEDRLAGFLLDAGLAPNGVDPRTHAQWGVWYQHRNSLRGGAAVNEHDDDLAGLEALDRPVLAFKGGGSPPFMREIVELLGTHVPNARVEELPGGHGLHIVSMERFLDILRAFLLNVDAGGKIV